MTDLLFVTWIAGLGDLECSWSKPCIRYPIRLIFGSILFSLIVDPK